MKFNFFILWILLFLLSACAAQPVQETSREFNGEQAQAYVSQLMEFGYRTPGSEAIQQAGLYIQQELSQYNWTVEFQDFEFQETPLRNITAKRTGGQRRISSSVRITTHVRSAIRKVIQPCKNCPFRVPTTVHPGQQCLWN